MLVKPLMTPKEGQGATVHDALLKAVSADPDGITIKKKFDLFKNGETYSREKRFYELPDQDLYDKAGLGSGALLERTGVMASSGEQVIVKTDGEGMIVRVHGIEEGNAD